MLSETKGQMYWRCVKLVANLSFQLAAVYFFEYIISAGSAGKVLTPDETCVSLSQTTCNVTLNCDWKVSDSSSTCESTIFLRRNMFVMKHLQLTDKSKPHTRPGMPYSRSATSSGCSSVDRRCKSFRSSGSASSLCSRASTLFSGRCRIL